MINNSTRNTTFLSIKKEYEDHDRIMNENAAEKQRKSYVMKKNRNIYDNTSTQASSDKYRAICTSSISTIR